MINKPRIKIASIGILSVFLGMGLTTGDIYLTILVTSVGILSFTNRTSTGLPIARIFTGFYLYLFVFRYVVLVALNETPQLGRLEVGTDQLRENLILVSQATILFLGILRTIKPKYESANHKANLNLWLMSEESNYFSNILFILSFLGFALMLFSSGSLEALTNSLFYHQKISITQNTFWQLGLTLWSLFATSALTLDLVKTIVHGGRYSRKILPLRSLFLLTVLVFVFGGRLSILIAGVITYAFVKFLSLPMKKSWIALGFISAIVFLLIGGARIGSTANILDFKQTIIATTYPVLDAAALVTSNPSDISNQLRSNERYSAYVKSLIPRFLWPSKPLLTNLTLDSQIANTFGYENQRGVTCWPSGFATEPYLIGGFIGTMTFVTILAIMFLVIQSRQNLAAGRKISGQIYIGDFALMYFLIAIVKDGDTFASLQSGLRLYIWLSVLLLFSNALRSLQRGRIRS